MSDLVIFSLFFCLSVFNLGMLIWLKYQIKSLRRSVRNVHTAVKIVGVTAGLSTLFQSIFGSGKNELDVEELLNFVPIRQPKEKN